MYMQHGAKMLSGRKKATPWKTLISVLRVEGVKRWRKPEKETDREKSENAKREYLQQRIDLCVCALQETKTEKHNAQDMLYDAKKIRKKWFVHAAQLFLY